MAQASRRKEEEKILAGIWEKPKKLATRVTPGSEEHEKLLVKQGYTPTEAFRLKSFHRDRALRKGSPPSMAKGGLVRRTGLIRMHAGERVLPARRRSR